MLVLRCAGKDACRLATYTFRGLAYLVSMDMDLHWDTEWDAGSMGCGELVLLLGAKLKTLPSGTCLKVIAQDSGATEDIPAWCRMTGNVLKNVNHPEYIIERKKG